MGLGVTAGAPFPGILSELEIDAAKDWQDFDVTNMGALQVNTLGEFGGLSTIGAEKIVNGGFDADTDWTKTGDVTISAGVATWGTATGYTGTLYPTVPISISIGVQYKLTFDLNCNNSEMDVSVGGYSAPTMYSDGTYTFVFTASATTNLVFDGTITPGGKGNALTVDNVSLTPAGDINGVIIAERFVLRSDLELEGNGVVSLADATNSLAQVHIAGDTAGAGALPGAFRGLLCTQYANGDMYIGNDNVFPGYYVQKTVVHNSVSADNSDDYTNLYQGDSLYQKIALMYAIEYSPGDDNGVEIGGGTTSPCPLIFKGDFELLCEPTNTKMMLRRKGGASSTMAFLEIDLDHKTFQECVRPNTDDKVDLGDIANVLRFRQGHFSQYVDCVTGYYVNGTQVISTQQTGIADAVVAHDLNAVFSDTEVEAALNALGTKINAIISALEAHGLLATV